MSRLNIDLDRDEGHEGYPNRFQITRTRNEYEKNFTKLTYAIQYGGKYINYDSWYNSDYYIYIRKRQRGDTIFTYCVNAKNHVVREVQVYFSKLHKDFPLIIGFKRDDGSKYFTYVYLKEQNYSYGFSLKEGFDFNQLNLKLVEENNKRNKLQFTIVKNQLENWDRCTDINFLDGFNRTKFFSKNKERDTHKMSMAVLLENQSLMDSSKIYELLNDMNGQYFDFITLFYIKSRNILLLIEFIADSNKTYLVRKNKDGSLWLIENIQNKDNESLKVELNKMETSLENVIFNLDKNITHDLSKNNVEVKSEDKKTYAFKKFIHTPKLSKPSTVFYKGSLFVIEQNDEILDSDKLKNAQNLIYTNIETYSLDKNQDFHLLIKFIQSNNKFFYFQRNDNSSKWKQIKVNEEDLNAENKIKDKLNEIEYPLKKFIIVRIEQNKQYNSNIVNLNSGIKVTTSLFTIRPGNCTSCGIYSCKKHGFSNLSSTHKNDVVGLRFSVNNNEVKIYNGKGFSEKDRQYVYYRSNSNDVYVYFYSQDPRPLLVCYDNKAYMAETKSNYENDQWSLASDITRCPCQGASIQTFTNKLNKLYNELNEVNICKNETHMIHTYNKTEIKINVTNTNDGCYTKFVYKPEKSGYMLGNLKYNTEYIKETPGNNIITALNYKEVVIYYHIKDDSLTNPLLIALCNDNRGRCSLYYSLNENGKKEYKRNTDTISLNNKDLLHGKLDCIFFNITKALQLIIKEKGPYEGKLYESNRSEVNTSVKTQNIRVEQQMCSKLSSSGYRCYKQNISRVSEIKDVGGLRIFLYDAKEINLYKNSDEKISKLTYNPCKGDLYVYLYGEDPRPLMLCFDGNAYGPKTKDEYDIKWYRIPNIKSSECNGITSENLLESLNEISMFLNPVKIEETINGKSSEEYSYIIHNFNDFNIKIYIKTKDLKCYKEYTHQHEHINNGYRLGRVQCNKRKTSNPVLSYPKRRQLQKVQFYYSVYDINLDNPILVILEFKENDKGFEKRYYRLKQKGGNSWEEMAENYYTEILKKLKEEDKIEEGLYDLRYNLDIKFNEEDKQKYLFNPEHCKEDEISFAVIIGSSVGGGLVGAATIGGGGYLIFVKIIASSATSLAV